MPPSESSSFSPAPYGQACAGCSRAKCKCFYRSEGSACERCHRLGKACEPALAIRKRKARTPPASSVPPPPPQPPTTRLEEKLDDIVTLLRSQAAEKKSYAQNQRQIPIPAVPEGSISGLGDSVSMTPAREHPDVVIDTAASVVHLLRPLMPASTSHIFSDVSIHQIPDSMAEEQLDLFRRSFISMFPFVHIPETMSAAELRSQKPFLWLVIMASTDKVASQQFVMAETIWNIISRRVLSQQFANIDLLLGIIAFAAWSHYFKKDKPFMSMLAQMAVSLALELCIHQEPATSALRRGRGATQQSARQRPRTMEERRTILAVFHLTSSAWSTYRKTEPLRWTPYMDDCLRLISEGKETHLDVYLAAQIKCQIITNHLTCPCAYELAGPDSLKVSSAVLTSALLRQLNDIQKSLPVQVRADRTIQFYLYFTELKIRESYLSRPRAVDGVDHTGVPHFQRLQDLEATLNVVERWIAVYYEMPLCDWVGFTADVFTQFTQYAVVLFKLTIVDEPGWDLQDVKRRADVFELLDRSCDNVGRVTEEMGMIDSDGPHHGLFFKMPRLLQEIKGLLLAELPPNMSTGAGLPTPDSGVVDDNTNGNAEFTGDFSFMDDIYLSMVQDDILAPVWDFRLDSSFMPFAS
ncbi:hypothetical protein F5Y04DRAFT_182934 [Hypomontagnella monticulosa]|nr:hypothetical protein F5Y04DRAFT_182934 [Hypomontagnella monticulosa]